MPGCYDLIVTNFFLDRLPKISLNDSFPGWQPPSRPGGRRVVGDFRLPKRGWPRVVSRAALAAMYAFFRLTTRLPTRRLVDPDPFLRQVRPGAGPRGIALARVSLGAILDEDVTASLRFSLSPPVAVRLKAVVRHRGGVDWLLLRHRHEGSPCCSRIGLPPVLIAGLFALTAANASAQDKKPAPPDTVKALEAELARLKAMERELQAKLKQVQTEAERQRMLARQLSGAGPRLIFCRNRSSGAQIEAQQLAQVELEKALKLKADHLKLAQLEGGRAVVIGDDVKHA